MTIWDSGEDGNDIWTLNGIHNNFGLRMTMSDCWHHTSGAWWGIQPSYYGRRIFKLLKAENQLQTDRQHGIDLIIRVRLYYLLRLQLEPSDSLVSQNVCILKRSHFVARLPFRVSPCTMTCHENCNRSVRHFFLLIALFWGWGSRPGRANVNSHVVSKRWRCLLGTGLSCHRPCR